VELARYLKVASEVTTLRYGDFAFAGWGPVTEQSPEGEIWSIGVERKTIRDLANSIQSGRLSGHQLIGLLDWYHVVYIVVEDTYRVRDNVIEIPEGRHWKPLQGKLKPGHVFGYVEIANYLNTLSIIPGVKLWFTPDLQTTALWIRHTYFWWQKKFGEHKAHLNFRLGPQLPKRMRLHRPTIEECMIKELPGVGWEKALEVAKAFPTMEELMQADPKELIKVPGIGKVLAKSIYERLHRK
jgi:ERCC4-type nuclease